MDNLEAFAKYANFEPSSLTVATASPNSFLPKTCRKETIDDALDSIVSPVNKANLFTTSVALATLS